MRSQLTSERAGEVGDPIRHSLAVCERIDAYVQLIEEQLAEIQGDAEFKDWRKHKLPRLDVLEVSDTGNRVSSAIQNRQGRVVSPRARQSNKIWSLLHMYEPQHLWIDCGRTAPSKIFGSTVSLQALYEFQVENGRHFHLCCDRNIFVDPDLASHPDLQMIREETLCACHRPPQHIRMGKMKGNNFLNQTHYVFTTSRDVHQQVDTRAGPSILPSAEQQASNTTPPRSTTRQLRLADKAAAAMMKDTSVPLLLSELMVVESKREADFNSVSFPVSIEQAQQVVKRRRLLRKQPDPSISKWDQPRMASWGEMFRKFGVRVPNRGRHYFSEGDEVAIATQQLIPHFEVKRVVMARGTNRVQLPKPGVDVNDIPLRQTIVVARQDGKVRVDGEPEYWARGVPKYKRWRAGIPARLSLTAYGMDRRPGMSGPARVSGHSVLDSLESAVASGEPRPGPSIPKPDDGVPFQHGPCAEGPGAKGSEEGQPIIPQNLEVGHPPVMVPRHGPAYLSLSEDEKREIGRLHQNLGHPDAAVMAKFLEERKADPRIVQGAKDYSCSVCLETVSGPKPARPASIHQDGDFGMSLVWI